MESKFEKCDRCDKQARITSYLNGRKRLCVDCYKLLLEEEDKQVKESLRPRDYEV